MSYSEGPLTVVGDNYIIQLYYDVPLTFKELEVNHSLFDKRKKKSYSTT